MRSLKSDNLTLVPASQLPFKEEWLRIADRLPSGSVLFVVPSTETPMKESMRRLATHMKIRGRVIHSIEASPRVTR